MERKQRPMDYSLVNKLKCPRKKNMKPRKSFQKYQSEENSAIIVLNSLIKKQYIFQTS